MHEEISGKSNVNEKHKTALRTNLSPSHLLRLKAAWRKVFNTMKFDTTDEDEIIVDETTEADDSEKKKEVKSLHDKNISLNSEVLTDRKIGKENMNKYLKVKEFKEEGWKYDKPAAHEILTVKSH